MTDPNLNDAEMACALLHSLRGRRVSGVDVERMTADAGGAPVLVALHLDDGRIVVLDTNGDEGVLSVYLDSDLERVSDR